MIRRRDKIAGAIGVFIVIVAAVGIWDFRWRSWSSASACQPTPHATGNAYDAVIVLSDQAQLAILAEKRKHDPKLAEARRARVAENDKVRIAQKKKYDAMLADSARKYPLPDNWPRNVRTWKSVMEPNGDMYLVPADRDPPPDRFFVSIAIPNRDAGPFELAEPSELAKAAAAVLRENQPMNPGRMRSFGEGFDRYAGVEFLGWNLAIVSVEPIGKLGWRAEVKVRPQRAFAPTMMVMGNVHLEVYRYVDGKLTLESQQPGPDNESPALRGQGDLEPSRRTLGKKGGDE